MWDPDGYAMDLAADYRDEEDDDAAFEEHDLNHDSEAAPVEGCYWCDQDVAGRQEEAA